jgi:hypothetical protein
MVLALLGLLLMIRASFMSDENKVAPGTTPPTTTMLSDEQVIRSIPGTVTDGTTELLDEPKIEGSRRDA